MRLLASVLGVVLLASSALADNIVVNGGFETGDLTSWTENTAASYPWEIGVAGSHGNVPFEGNYFVTMGCTGAECVDGTAAQQANLSQTLLTQVGSPYTLTFQFYTGGNVAPNELNVLWDGVSVLDLGAGGTLGEIDNYTLFTVGALVGTGSDTLTFLGRQDTGWNALDAITVSATPEPPTWMMMAMAIPLVAFVARRVKTSA